MEQCEECKQEVGQEWYIPASNWGITPFCSEGCANKHRDRLIEQGGYIKVIPEYPNELIIDMENTGFGSIKETRIAQVFITPKMWERLKAEKPDNRTNVLKLAWDVIMQSELDIEDGDIFVKIQKLDTGTNES